MATSGPSAPGTGENYNDGAFWGWSTTSNVTVDDANYATVNGVTSAFPSQVLIARNFGHALTDVSTIDGIEFSVKRRKTGSFGNTRDNVIQCTKNATTGVGDNKADTGTNWPTSVASVTYGGASDLWGTTWTEAEIESANFGLRIKAAGSDGNGTNAEVTYVTSTVYYTQTGGGGAVSSNTLMLLGCGV